MAVRQPYCPLGTCSRRNIPAAGPVSISEDAFASQLHAGATRGIAFIKDKL
jgi:hypothetical protein